MNQQIQRVRKHLLDNKTAYIVGGVCLVVSVVAGTRRSRKVSVTIPSVQPQLVSFKRLQDGLKNARIAAIDAIDKSGNYPLDMMYQLGRVDAFEDVQDLMTLEGVLE